MSCLHSACSVIPGGFILCSNAFVYICGPLNLLVVFISIHVLFLNISPFLSPLSLLSDQIRPPQSVCLSSHILATHEWRLTSNDCCWCCMCCCEWRRAYFLPLCLLVVLVIILLSSLSLLLLFPRGGLSSNWQWWWWECYLSFSTHNSHSSLQYSQCLHSVDILYLHGPLMRVTISQ